MKDRVFTGDTLLINGTGRTDFQGGSAKDQYNSIFNNLLKLPEETLVYPAHDYNGKKYSTIIQEKNNNPRLQVDSPDEYIEIMNNLKLANPKMMDIAVPANKKGFFLKDFLVILAFSSNRVIFSFLIFKYILYNSSFEGKNQSL